MMNTVKFIGVQMYLALRVQNNMLYLNGDVFGVRLEK